MNWAVPFAISAAISVTSTLVKSHFAGKRQDKMEALAKERKRLLDQRSSIEAKEAQNTINRERRLKTAIRRSTAVGQGQAVEKGLGSSSNLADRAIASSAEGASTLLGQRLQSTLALSQSEYDIATFDSTPGMAEQIGLGILGAGSSVAGSIGTSALKTRLASSKSLSDVFEWR
jgi:hypothetical protein